MAVMVEIDESGRSRCRRPVPRRTRPMGIARSLTVGLLLALAACTTKPDAPRRDNPFDPAGEDPGSGYGLSATVQGDSVLLTWSDLPEVVAYTVFHSASSPAFEDMVAATGLSAVSRTGVVATAVHRDFAPEATNYYRVQGTTSVPLQASVAVAVDVPALLSPASGSASTSTRFVRLRALTGTADRLEVSNAADFSASTIVTVTPGVPTEFDWTLPPVDTPGTLVWIHHRPLSGTGTGSADSLALTARFSPSLTPVRGQRFSATAAANVAVDTLVVFQPTGLGIVGLRVVDPDSVVTVVTDPLAPVQLALAPTATGPATWTAVFTGDFGYEVSQGVTLTPATEITDVSIEVAGGVTTTTDPQIELVVHADGAGEMILSELPDFADTSWQAFADTVTFTLSSGVGDKTVFAAFRNPFVSERPTSRADITLLAPPPGALRANSDGAGRPPRIDGSSR